MTSSDSGDQTNEPGQGDGAMPPTHQPYGKPAADNPYGPPPTQNPYGEMPAVNPYGETPAQPPYGPPQAAPYGQPAYGAPQQPGYAYGYGSAAPVNHPSATTALVLSLIGLAGVVLCGGITLVLSPFAWRSGAKAVREIDANPAMYGGRDQANAGRIMGIIGTVLLVLGILGLIALIVLVAVSASTSA